MSEQWKDGRDPTWAQLKRKTKRDGWFCIENRRGVVSRATARIWIKSEHPGSDYGSTLDLYSYNTLVLRVYTVDGVPHIRPMKWYGSVTTNRHAWEFLGYSGRFLSLLYGLYSTYGPRGGCVGFNKLMYDLLQERHGMREAILDDTVPLTRMFTLDYSKG